MKEFNDPYLIMIHYHSIILISKVYISLFSVTLNKHNDFIVISSLNDINSFLPKIIQRKIKDYNFLPRKIIEKRVSLLISILGTE